LERLKAVTRIFNRGLLTSEGADFKVGFRHLFRDGAPSHLKQTQ